MKVIVTNKKKDTDTVKLYYQMETLMKDIILMVNAMDRLAQLSSRVQSSLERSNRVHTNTNPELVTWANIKTTRSKVLVHSTILMGLSMKVSSSTIICNAATYIIIISGFWSADQRNGKGVYTYANGDTYNGEWSDNLRHGQGIYQFADTGAKVSWCYINYCKPV